MSDYKYKPYYLNEVSAVYFSGDIEESPYKAARKVLKKLEKDDPQGPTSITLTVTYAEDAKDGPYWAATVVGTT